VFGSDKVGNFVVTTPLLRGLKEKYLGCALDFFGGETTADLEAACPYVDARFSLYGARDDYLGDLHSFVAGRRNATRSYDLAINCDEFSVLNQVLVGIVAPRYLVGAALAPDMRGPIPPGDDVRARLLRDDDWNWSGHRRPLRRPAPNQLSGRIFCRIAYVDTDCLPASRSRTVPPPVRVPDVLLHVSDRSAKAVASRVLARGRGLVRGRTR
jgi:hypothetical protein